MIKLGNKNKRAKEEELKREEDPTAPLEPLKKKKSPGEIRIQKELMEIDVPIHAKVEFPNKDDIMTM